MKMHVIVFFFIRNIQTHDEFISAYTISMVSRSGAMGEIEAFVTDSMRRKRETRTNFHDVYVYETLMRGVKVIRSQ